MKKLSALAVTALLLISGVKAQISYGVKLGANFSSVKGEDYDDDDKKTKLGFLFGGLVNIPVAAEFSVQPELLYSQEGVMWKADDYKEKETMTYLNIPVLAQYDHPSGFFAQTGPQVGFLLSAKEKYTEDGEDEESYDFKDEMKGINFSWAFGAGYRHSSGIGGGVRYNLGLSNIVDDDDYSAKTRCFTVFLFYMLGKSK